MRRMISIKYFLIIYKYRRSEANLMSHSTAYNINLPIIIINLGKTVIEKYKFIKIVVIKINRKH